MTSPPERDIHVKNSKLLLFAEGFISNLLDYTCPVNNSTVMDTWEVMLCCQCGHPTTAVPYPLRWRTTCCVCSHRGCLYCNFSSSFDQNSNLYLNYEEQVPGFDITAWNENNSENLTEAGSTRGENGAKSDLETPGILVNEQIDRKSVV